MNEKSRRLQDVLRRRQGVATAAELREEGFPRHAVQWALQTGELLAVRHGVYTGREKWERTEPSYRHILQIRAHQRVNPALVASGASAAIALGLPTPGAPPERPQLTAVRPAVARGAARAGGRGNQGGALVRCAQLGSDEIWTLRSGMRVTSPVRTVFDCARVWDRPWGLAVADAAVYQGLITADRLGKAAEQRGGVSGADRVRWVAGRVRPEVESPLESLARAVIVLGGFPEPTPQVWLRTRLGNDRVDLFDQKHRLVTEADGRLKYARGEDVYEEKRREDAIRELGHRLIRFGMDDYRNPDPWLVVYRRNTTEHPKSR